MGQYRVRIAKIGNSDRIYYSEYFAMRKAAMPVIEILNGPRYTDFNSHFESHEG